MHEKFSSRNNHNISASITDGSHQITTAVIDAGCYKRTVVIEAEEFAVETTHYDSSRETSSCG